MAQALQAKLKEPQTDENKRGPRPQDLIRLYEIILQVRTQSNQRTLSSSTCPPAFTCIPGRTKLLNLET